MVHRNRRQRARGGHHRAVRHEAAAHGGTPARDAAPQPEIGAGHRLRRRRFGRHLYPLSRNREHHDLRNRAGHSAHVHPVFRPAELRGLPQSPDARHFRRRPPLPDDHQVEVRHHRLRPARRVRQRNRLALFEGVLRGRAAAPQSGRHLHPLRAALRERRAHRQERDGDVLRSLSGRPPSGPIR